MLSLVYYNLSWYKSLLSVTFFCLGIIVTSQDDLILRAAFLAVLAVVLHLLFESIYEYALIIILVLLAMFIGKKLKEENFYVRKKEE